MNRPKSQTITFLWTIFGHAARVALTGILVWCTLQLAFRAFARLVGRPKTIRCGLLVAALYWGATRRILEEECRALSINPVGLALRHQASGWLRCGSLERRCSALEGAGKGSKAIRHVQIQLENIQ